MWMKFRTFWKMGWVSLPNYFRTLLFRKEVATETSRRSVFKTPFDNQRVNGLQTPLKVARHHYYPFFLFIVNTLTADDKYSCRNMQNFLPQLQTLLSEKRKTLSGFFITYLKFAWNSEHFEKKDECPSVIISEFIVSERGCYWNV